MKDIVVRLTERAEVLESRTYNRFGKFKESDDDRINARIMRDAIDEIMELHSMLDDAQGCIVDELVIDIEEGINKHRWW